MVRDKHNLAIGDALEVPAVQALAVTRGGLHQLVTRGSTTLEGELLHDSNQQTPCAALNKYDSARESLNNTYQILETEGRIFIKDDLVIIHSLVFGHIAYDMAEN